MSCLWLLLLSLCSATASGVDTGPSDVNALVQVQSHSHLQHEVGFAGMAQTLAESFSRQLEQAANDDAETRALGTNDFLAEGPESHLFVKRAIQNSQGNHVEMSFGDGCGTQDKSEDNDCTLHWGETVQVRSIAHIKRGLTKGDKVVLSIASRIRALNETHPMSSLLQGRGFKAEMVCTMCMGSCKFSLREEVGSFRMDGTSPSGVANHSFCSGVDQGSAFEFPLMDFSLKLPNAPPDAWQLSADVRVTTQLQTASGQMQVLQVLEPRIIPGTAARTAGRAHATKHLKAEPTQPTSFADSLTSTLRKSTHATVDEALKHQLQSGSRKNPGQKKISLFTAKILVSDLEHSNSGRNFTLTADSGCTPTDSLGSTECKFPVGKAGSISLGVHLAYTSEEGSYAELQVTPKIRGLLGFMAGSFFPTRVLRVPLCGPVIVKAGMMRKLFNTGECGLHTLNIVAPAMSFMIPSLSGWSLKDSGLPLIKMLPGDLADMPPLSTVVEVRMRHSDGRTIGNAVIELGLS